MKNKLKPDSAVLTILVCCYNAERFLKKCLDSLRLQTAVDSSYRILFINDASTDRSLQIANFYARKLKNLIVLNNKKNLGLVKCCNKALMTIQTPYFLRLDADDYLPTDALERILQKIRVSKNKDFFIFQRWDVCNGTVKKIELTQDIYNWVAAGAVFATAAVKSVGGYSDQYWEEYDLYLKLLTAGYKYNVFHFAVCYYRRGHGSMTENHENNIKGASSLLKKWGAPTLNKYGDYKRIIDYYNRA